MKSDFERRKMCLNVYGEKNVKLKSYILNAIFDQNTLNEEHAQQAHKYTFEKS